MTRLIDADALHDDLRAKQKWIVKRDDKHNEGYTYDQVHFAIDEQPTVDAIPVEWINHYMDTNLTKVSLFYSCMSEFVRDWQKEQEKNNGN